MPDSVFNRAIKPLDFRPVEVKTDTKLKTFSVVWDIKKLFTYVTFTDQLLSLGVRQTGAGLLLQQYNFNWGHNTRILNFQRLQAKLPPDVTIGNILKDVVFCVKFVKDNIVYRYKIAGRKQDLWDVVIGLPKLYKFDYAKTSNVPDAFEPAMAVVAPWYNGERIESKFVIEIWSAAENTNRYDLGGSLILQLSNLTNPTSLTDRQFATAGTGYSRADLGFTYPQAIPEVYPAPTVGN